MIERIANMHRDVMLYSRTSSIRCIWVLMAECFGSYQWERVSSVAGFDDCSWSLILTSTAVSHRRKQSCLHHHLSHLRGRVRTPPARLQGPSHHRCQVALWFLLPLCLKDVKALARRRISGLTQMLSSTIFLHVTVECQWLYAFLKRTAFSQID